MQAAALAIAGAVVGNRCDMTNLQWVVDGDQLQATHGFRCVSCMEGVCVCVVWCGGYVGVDVCVGGGRRRGGRRGKGFGVRDMHFLCVLGGGAGAWAKGEQLRILAGEGIINV